MDKQQVDILIDGSNWATVEMLAPKIARVVEPGRSLKVSENDILSLTHDPGQSAAPPSMAEVLHRRNPVLSEIEFWTPDNRNRLIALAAALGLEIVDIEDIAPNLEQLCGTIRIAHPEKIDVNAIAMAAGVTDMPFDDMDDDEEDVADEAPPEVKDDSGETGTSFKDQE